MSRVEHLAPKSLFNRQTSKKREAKAALKLRKEQAALALKGAARLPSLSAGGGLNFAALLEVSTFNVPSRRSGAATDDKDGNVSAVDKSGTGSGQNEPVVSGGGSSKNPEWLMIEDCKLLQV